MSDDAVRAAGDLVPVEQDDADDLAEAQRDDGQIVAAQAQHRKAQQDAEAGREQAGQRQAGPEAQAEGLREQRVGIGADRVEGDVAEVEQAGEADHDVQAPAEHDVDQHGGGDVDHVAVGERQERQDERRTARAPATAPNQHAAGRRCAWPSAWSAPWPGRGSCSTPPARPSAAKPTAASAAPANSDPAPPASEDPVENGTRAAMPVGDRSPVRMPSRRRQQARR